MKLIVQIPCFNEEHSLPATVADVPREIDGVDRVEVLVVDDGSTDRTADVARAAGVDHVVRHTTNRGLASAFRTGLDSCLARGADVIVNTDGDNQYRGEDIPALVRPILEGRADLVVGDRQVRTVADFSPSKKLLQRVGSLAVRRFSRVRIPDAVSGFRALSRDAAFRINIVSSFSYTIEMLVQAGEKRMRVESVPVRVNPKVRESRLFRSVPQFIAQSAVTLLRTTTMYRPLRMFSYLGGLFLVLGGLPILRFLYFFFESGGAGHVQSLVLGGALLVIGFLMLLVGVVSDLISFNRKLTEILLEKVRRLESERPAP